MLRTKKGFTLLELIVVLVVLAILALIAIPSYAAVMQKAAERAALVSAQAAARDANALAAISDHSAVVSDADMATVFAELPAGMDAVFAAGSGDSAGADTFWGTSDDSFDANEGEATITITVTKGGQSGSATVDNAGGKAAAS